MHLDSITQFRKKEPKKKYPYTYLRFDKGKHTELTKHTGVSEIEGTIGQSPFILSTFSFGNNPNHTLNEERN